MALIKSTATAQLLLRKKKKKTVKEIDKTEAAKTRIKSIKKNLSGKTKHK